MKYSLLVTAIVALAFAGGSGAADLLEFSLVIKDHAYQPTELRVPADTKFRLRVTNEDATPEEFESTDFNRESVVLPNRSIVVSIGPLRAGSYGFFGDFHRDTAQGRLVAE